MMRHYLQMTAFMVVAGLLSTMNVWADSVSDIRLSLNDAYMVALMTGWMLLFMALSRGDGTVAAGSGVFVAIAFLAIRNQWFVTESQFLAGMIPHHSMAVTMSKRMQTKPNQIGTLLENIIQSQSAEIQWMKTYLGAASS